MSRTQAIPDLLQGLADLGQRSDLEMRPILLRVLTDLFVSRESHPREDIRRYEEIALGLIGKTDEATRAILAGKLARSGATPRSLIDFFLKEGGANAAEFLRCSNRIDRARLLALAGAGDVEAARAIATRTDLDAALVAALVERPEPEIARTLAANAAAPLDANALASLARRGRRDPELGRLICGRVSDPVLLTPLFRWASPSQRAAIILSARRDRLANLERAPRYTIEQIDTRELERAAVLGDRPLLHALVARALQIGLAEASDLVDDERGEPMALILSALRVPPEIAARVFMSLAPPIAHSHERVRALCALVVDVSPRVARDLLGSILLDDKPAAPVHASHLDPTAAATPSRAASTARDVAVPPARRGLFAPRRRA